MHVVEFLNGPYHGDIDVIEELTPTFTVAVPHLSPRSGFPGTPVTLYLYELRQRFDPGLQEWATPLYVLRSVSQQGGTS
jgi:hypothetical protein